MKATRIIAKAAGMTALAVMLLGSGSIAAATKVGRIVPAPNELQVWIWPDRGEGGEYVPGDEIAMYVEASRDCYLILYNIDTRGRLNILYPLDPWTDNFIRGGEVVRFPQRSDAVDWLVEGPPGVEYVQAIATTFPVRPPDWPVYLRSVNGRDGVCLDKDLNDFRAYDDRLDYIRVVNRKITRRYWDWAATDLATFHVRRRNHWININAWDPWPNEFYGEIYIGWPVGGEIFIDGVFIGRAPLRVPRGRWGRRIITCYMGNRLVRWHEAHVYQKREYRYRRPAYRSHDVFAGGHVKIGKRGRPDRFVLPRRHRDAELREKRRVRSTDHTSRGKIEARQPARNQGRSARRRVSTTEVRDGKFAVRKERPKVKVSKKRKIETVASVSKPKRKKGGFFRKVGRAIASAARYATDVESSKKSRSASKDKGKSAEKIRKHERDDSKADKAEKRSSKSGAVAAKRKKR